MSTSFCIAFYLVQLISLLNCQISLGKADSQSNLQPISNQLDSASVAQYSKSPHSHPSSYPIPSEYDIPGRYYDSSKPHPGLELRYPIGQEKSHVSDVKPIILESNEGEDKRAFKFGKRPNTDSDFNSAKRNKMAFKFGKRFEPLESDDADKRAFKFGKKSNLEPLDYDKRPAFKFGKRFSALQYEDSYDDAEEKRAFKFGKRADEETIKRMFKFGKRPQSGGYLNDEAILGDANTKDWDDIRDDSYNGLYDSPRSINPDDQSFIPAELAGVNPEDQVEDKRAFKFGKKSSLDDWRERMREAERRRQRGRQNEVDRRRLFKLGKRSEAAEYEELKDEDMIKRQFKFGK